MNNSKNLETGIFEDVLGALDNKKLSNKSSMDDDIGTTVLKDVLGALEKEDKPIPVKVEESFPEFPEELLADLNETPQIPNTKPLRDINKTEQIEGRIVELEKETAKLKAIIETQKKDIDQYTTKLATSESENTKLRTELTNAKDNMRMEFEAQLNKAAIIEQKYNELAARHEELKAKVRRDIRKIRMREKELAHKLELMKQDSETLLSAKDQKIIQLKKQIDTQEFDIETLNEKIDSLLEKVKEDEEKAQRVVRALRLSTSLLETSSKKKII